VAARIFSLIALTATALVALVVLVGVAKGSVFLLLIPVALTVAAAIAIVQSGQALARYGSALPLRVALFIAGSVGAAALMALTVLLVILGFGLLVGGGS